jgi:hypothetical protein
MDGRSHPLPSPGDDRQNSGSGIGDPATLTLIKDILTREGVVFIDENGGGAGVRLRKPSNKGPKKIG